MNNIVSKNFIKTSSVFMLMGMSLFSFSAKAMDPGEENSHSHSLTINLAWEERLQKLEKENLTLKNTIREMKEKLYPSKIFKASLSNKDSRWVSHGPSWKVLQFDSVEGNVESDSLSAFIIPEDGFYSLRVRCCWRSIGDYTDFMTAIAVDHLEQYKSLKNLHIIGKHQLIDEFDLNTHLNQGQKVMTTVFGRQDAEYGTGAFQFFIEKIN